MAFPDYAMLLDDFNRPDGAAGPNWSVGVLTPSPSLLVISNQGGLVAPLGEGCWTAAQMDSLVEVYCQLPVLPAVNGLLYLFGRVVDPGTGSQTGYCASYNFVAMAFELYRVDGGSLVFLNGVVQAFAPGDWMGLRCEGSDITGHHKPAAGVWSQIVSAVDATYPGPGYTGVAIGDDSGAGRIDDFSAGPLLDAIAPEPATAVAEAVLGSVTAVLDARTVELVGTAEGAAPHQVLNLRQDDQLPVVLFVWRDEDGDGLNFDEATVYFRMRARMADVGDFKVDTECLKLDGGQVVWSAVSGDLDTPGEYYAYLVADYGGDVYRTSEVIVVRVWEAL